MPAACVFFCSSCGQLTLGEHFATWKCVHLGIIHPCAHPEDRPAPTSELEMYHNVTTYVDRLFAAIRPKQLLYLAIDGVAPRAKVSAPLPHRHLPQHKPCMTLSYLVPLS